MQYTYSDVRGDTSFVPVVCLCSCDHEKDPQFQATASAINQTSKAIKRLGDIVEKLKTLNFKQV